MGVVIRAAAGIVSQLSSDSLGTALSVSRHTAGVSLAFVYITLLACEPKRMKLYFDSDTINFLLQDLRQTRRLRLGHRNPTVTKLSSSEFLVEAMKIYTNACQTLWPDPKEMCSSGCWWLQILLHGEGRLNCTVTWVESFSYLWGRRGMMMPLSKTFILSTQCVASQ